MILNKTGSKWRTTRPLIFNGETDHGVAVVRGLNIANECFRIDHQNTGRYWRDQDVMVTGDAVKDMVATFDRNFEYFLKVKESRGILNTNSYWEATRHVFEKTGTNMFYSNDLGFSKQITLEDTEAFADSTDSIYQLQKEFGLFIGAH